MARKRRDPPPVIIRRLGEEEDVVGVVPAGSFPGLRTLADYAFANVRFEPFTPWELIEEQELLALQQGAPGGTC